MDPLHHLRRAAQIVRGTPFDDELARVFGDDPRDTLREKLERAREQIRLQGVPMKHLNYSLFQAFMWVRDTIEKPLGEMSVTQLRQLAERLLLVADSRKGDWPISEEDGIPRSETYLR